MPGELLWLCQSVLKTGQVFAVVIPLIVLVTPRSCSLSWTLENCPSMAGPRLCAAMPAVWCSEPEWSVLLGAGLVKNTSL